MDRNTKKSLVIKLSHPTRDIKILKLSNKHLKINLNLKFPATKIFYTE